MLNGMTFEGKMSKLSEKFRKKILVRGGGGKIPPDAPPPPPQIPRYTPVYNIEKEERENRVSRDRLS